MASTVTEMQSGSLRDRLLADRLSLLDLGTRNRLIDVPLRSKAIRTLEIVDEKAAEILRLLTEGKGFSFLPGREISDDERGELNDDDRETRGIPQPDETDSADERGVAKRHTDSRLQTRLTSEALQKRLFDIWYDARTLEEEQGVNVLYLALGLLRWYETGTSEKARHAPLILLPVRLERANAATRFTLRGRNDPPSPNPSLQAMLKGEHGIKVDDFGEDEEFDLAAHIGKIADTIEGKPRWEVLPDAILLGFFSFAKFLMYRDLDPENWPAEASLDRHPIISGLLGEGFEAPQPIFSETERIDNVVHPLAMSHVVDADSSQSIVIEEVLRGRNLVVKGPPGTGKSQTITNVIAGLVAQGKSVLFVAEKMAALDVVHRRLRSVGLGALALELHSRKANRRDVLAELKRTKELPVRQARGDVTVIKRLTDARDVLNTHADTMGATVNPSRLSPYELLGHLLRIKDSPALLGVALQEPVRWTPDDRALREELLAEIADRLDTLGDPVHHAWRGVRRAPLDPAELDTLKTDVASIAGVFDVVTKAANGAAKLLGLAEPNTIAELEGLRRLLAAISRMPECDLTALDRAVWRSRSDAAGAAVHAGRLYAGTKALMDPVFKEAAWSTPLGECRNVLAERGRSLGRLFSRQYWSQRSMLRSLLNEPLPRSLDERLAIIDAMMSAQATRRTFETINVAGVEAFGKLWKGEASDWDRLRAIVDWRTTHGASLSSEILSCIARTQNLAGLKKLHTLLEQWAPRLWSRLDALTTFLELDISRAFGSADFAQNTLASLAARFEAWRSQPEALTRWIAFFDRCRTANIFGLGRLMHALLDGRLTAETLGPTFERAYYDAIRTDSFARLPSLKHFDGELHGRIVQSFRSLDVDRIALAREQIAARHATSLPRTGGIGPLGVLNGEIAKKRNHLSIRKLLEKAGAAIQQIKPIFMMSPLSVAQFLKPGALSFDVLVIDEASQIEPVDSLGAIARCRQVVVVGDERQLPPTRFFSKLTSEIEDWDEDSDVTFETRDAESVLDLCLAKGMPDRMLNWHYRSRHQSLIALSNREFYDDRLVIAPSPYDRAAGIGLKFNHLPGARYDRGNSRANPIEAKAVAEAVMARAGRHPDQSLGVATFSVAQRKAILQELELLRRAQPENEEFFTKESIEPFFVKNLENIQGDERDVIMISVGYGRTADGKAPMSFGPLNGEGGERRLNVLISRARSLCEIFSSITGADLDPERIRSRGVDAFRKFLIFAEKGQIDTGAETEPGGAGLLEEEVAGRLRALGHDVRTKVGTVGFLFDLAVADPEAPDRYLLGIEFDGPHYQKARSARDRDRLRQQVAESRGWIVHRLWAMDWYLRPGEELAKLQAAIASAKAEWRLRDDDAVKAEATAPSPEDVPLEASAQGLPDVAELATPYEQAALSVRTELDPHEVSAAEMAGYVAEVVAAEGPIHETEILNRIRAAWGMARSGSRIRDAVQAGIDVARREGRISGGPFYTAPNQEIRVRNRSEAPSATVRKLEHLPPSEIDAALLALVDANFGAHKEQLVASAARLFGFGTTSTQLRSLIESRIERALSDGSLRQDADVLVRARFSDAPAPRASAGAM